MKTMVSGDCEKVMTAEEAVSCFIKDGDVVAFGGFVTNRRAYALVREMIRQKKKDLYIEGGSSGGDIDMLIGAGCVKEINVSYVANSGYTNVCRRFRAAVENGEILFEDYSLDAMTIAYHGAALGLPYVPVKNMLGSDLEREWGISEEERRSHSKLPPEKFLIREDPFRPGSRLCLLPTPEIDAAVIHVQMASPDGTVRIEGAPFQDVDIAMAAKHTIISCEELVSNEEIRRHPEKNTLTGLCVDAVVHLPFGAHPSQCFGYYDYDREFYQMYDKVSRTQEDFDEFLKEYVTELPTHGAYLDHIGASRLLKLKAVPGVGYAVGSTF
jgi:glutaconate CoA-transferase subunit A